MTAAAGVALFVLAILDGALAGFRSSADGPGWSTTAGPITRRPGAGRYWPWSCWRRSLPRHQPIC
jgi:hypothetical protein